MNLSTVHPIDHSYSASESSELDVESQAAQTIVRDHRHLIASSEHAHTNITLHGRECPTFAAYSNMSSVGESEPPSPTSGPPANFDIVAPGIYRSSFPRIGNFEHLRSLGLKTILTLVPEEYPPENKDFVKENCIRHFQIPIPANKDPFVTIPPKDIAAALEILLDTRHHPVLIHCNKGKHRTGCVVGCYRKIHDWTNPSIIAEYRRYAAHKARVLDERFIELFDQHAAMAGVGKETDVVVSAQQTMPTPPSSVKGDPKDDETPVTRMHRGVSKSSDASSTV